MERFKRKLTLLNIPVLEINDLTELEEALLEFTKQPRVMQSQAVAADQNQEPDSWRCSSDIPRFDLLLGVEESSILFTENEVFRDFVKSTENKLAMLVLKERNIVETIEVALYKVNNGSHFYGKVLEIIEPKDIPKNCIILITKK